MTDKTINWLIVGGCPRSGTTMLNYLLNSSPHIYLSNEQNLFRSVKKVDSIFNREDHLNKRSDRKLTEKERLLDPKKLKELKLAATIQRQFSKKKVIEVLYYESLVQNTNPEIRKIYLGDKFPRYYEWNIQELIHHLGGNVKFIHIVRSPLDTINSNLFRSKNALKGEDWYFAGFLSDIINQWIKAYNFTFKASHNGLDILNIKYEDLVTYNSKNGRLIAEFLDIADSFDYSLITKNNVLNKEIDKKSLKKIKKYVPEEILLWDKEIDYYHSEFGSLKEINSTKISMFTYKIFRKYVQITNVIKK